MSIGTPATRASSQVGVVFRVIEYDYVAGSDRIGLQAAEAIGVEPGRVLKTLTVEVDGRPACAVIPSDRVLSMKRVAAAFGGKSAQMMAPDKAERLTGFHTGGMSPFGQRRRHPTAFEATAFAGPEVVVNGGRRGLMLALAPDSAVAVASATRHILCAD